MGGSILEELLDEEGGVKQGSSSPGGSSSSSGEDGGTPVVMIHGDADQVVPLRRARRCGRVDGGGCVARGLCCVGAVLCGQAVSQSVRSGTHGVSASVR